MSEQERTQSDVSHLLGSSDGDDGVDALDAVRNVGLGLINAAQSNINRTMSGYSEDFLGNNRQRSGQ